MLKNRERGQGLVELALIFAFVAVIVFVVVEWLGTKGCWIYFKFHQRMYEQDIFRDPPSVSCPTGPTIIEAAGKQIEQSVRHAFDGLQIWYRNLDVTSLLNAIGWIVLAIIGSIILAAAIYTLFKGIKGLIKLLLDFTISLNRLLQRLLHRFQKAVSSNAKSKSKDMPLQYNIGVLKIGFAPQSQPNQPLKPKKPLLPGRAYYFCVELNPAYIVRQTEYSKVPLHIALFGFSGEIEWGNGEDIGEISLNSSGQYRVTNQPVTRLPGQVASNNMRLFFPVRTPSRRGKHRLRCHIYYQQSLLQSVLVTVRVSAISMRRLRNTLHATPDFTLTNWLSPIHLQQMGDTRFSLLLNDSGSHNICARLRQVFRDTRFSLLLKRGGTHDFRFFGKHEGKFIKKNVMIGEGKLQNLLCQSRESLRCASWGKPEPYQEGDIDRYKCLGNREQIQKDLILLAIEGFHLYDTIISPLTGGNKKREKELLALMRIPGQVQISFKESVNLVIPASLIYDYTLAVGKKIDQLSVCQQFLEALDAKIPLETTQCFQGNCPNKDCNTVVCPSGFWGYRHQLGFPVSVENGLDALPFIPIKENNKLVMGVSTDKKLVRRIDHESILRGFVSDWGYADSCDMVIDKLKERELQLVYFYCHGGLDKKGRPYLSFGEPGEDRFYRATLRGEKIEWERTRPLIFINGCHTAALEPDKAIDLVSGFIETSNAVGVIGTEIGVFESLAAPFAEDFLRRFLIEHQSVGEAIRGTRLKLLSEGNPLGLVYIPFVMPGLHLQHVQPKAQTKE